MGEISDYYEGYQNDSLLDEWVAAQDEEAQEPLKSWIKMMGRTRTMNYGAQVMNPAMFDQGAIWIDKTNKVWALKDLTDEHLTGIQAWLEAWWERQLRARYAEYSERPIGHVHSTWRTTTLGGALRREQDRREKSHRESAAGELEDDIIATFNLRDLGAYTTKVTQKHLAHAVLMMMHAKGWKVEKK